MLHSKAYPVITWKAIDPLYSATGEEPVSTVNHVFCSSDKALTTSF